MAQSEESTESQSRSPNSHLSHTDAAISSLDILNSYRNSSKNQASVSVAAAAFILKAAADSQNSRKSMTLPSPLSSSGLKPRCSSPTDTDNASSAVASLMSRQPRQHSPTTNSKIQTAIALAMAASSPPSTCPSSSSSGHPGEHGNAGDFRCDAQSSLGAIFRQPGPTAVGVGNAGATYETVDGGANGSGDLGGFATSCPGNLPPFVPFTSSSALSPEMSASACLTNAMLLPASIVNVLGQQMQGNQYHQPQSSAYIPCLSNSGSGGFPGQVPQPQQQTVLHQQQQQQQQPPSQQQQQQGDPTRVAFGPPTGTGGGGGGGGGLHTASSPSHPDTGRYNTQPNRMATLHDEGNSNKREQRLLKNREAARECRRKKKEYVRCLERQVSILQSQNQQLIEELQKVKALCSGALLEQQQQSQCLQGPPNLVNDRHGAVGGQEGNGMDFVDSVASPSSSGANSASGHQPRHHRKPPRLSSSSSWRESNNPNNNKNTFHSEMDVDGVSSTSRQQVVNELTNLKSPVSQAHQLLLLKGLSALKGSGVYIRKGEDGSEYVHGGPWSSSGEKKPDNLENCPQTQAHHSNASPSAHIHPVKRALKLFGNEQQQQVGGNGRRGKPEAHNNH